VAASVQILSRAHGRFREGHVYAEIGPKE